jgi:hypothetical protein
VFKVLNVMLGLRMYVFCIITAFRVAPPGATVQPNMTSNGGPATRSASRRSLRGRHR